MATSGFEAITGDGAARFAAIAKSVIQPPVHPFPVLLNSENMVLSLSQITPRIGLGAQSHQPAPNMDILSGFIGAQPQPGTHILFP